MGDVGTYSISAEQSAELKSLGIYISPRTAVFHCDTYYEPPLAVLSHHRSYKPCELGAFSYAQSDISNFVQRMGRYCSIAHRVEFGSTEHPTSWLSTSSFTYDPHFELFKDFAGSDSDFQAKHVPKEKRHSAITIGDDVWIGLSAYIRGGVELGTGCIVGTGAVVTKDVPPYAIVAGNPAQIKRFRFSEEVIARLLASRWWEYKFTDFSGLDLSDVERSLAFLEQTELVPYRPEKIRITDYVTRVD